jgi:peptidoglycan/LPS O-acetylase OafA/YrhL
MYMLFWSYLCKLTLLFWMAFAFMFGVLAVIVPRMRIGSSPRAHDVIAVAAALLISIGMAIWNDKDDLFQGIHVCEAPFHHLACFLNHLCCNGRDVSTAPSGAHCVLPGDVSLL